MPVLVRVRGWDEKEGVLLPFINNSLAGFVLLILVFFRPCSRR